MRDTWTGEMILETARSFQTASVLLAGAELDLFTPLARKPLTAGELASAIHGDPRGTTVLADALAALRFLEKREGRYSPTPGVAEALAEGTPESVVPMLRHQANCMRSWAQLAAVVQSGRAADAPPSVRGAEEDQVSFIEAMEVASRAAAPKVVAGLGPLSFRRLLDVGGGPGTWTIAFLRAAPGARATIYDLPEVVPIARRHVEEAGLAGRVDFAGGSYATDAALPPGHDFAWVSAIIHQNSRRENRDLFRKVHAALVPGGEIAIRDIVMDESRVSPPAGALFAVNMLVRTDGGTYTLGEIAEDLREAGFGPPSLVRGERDMDSVVRARRA
jgi:predicted O-methyltransferase YrrM